MKTLRTIFFIFLITAGQQTIFSQSTINSKSDYLASVETNNMKVKLSLDTAQYKQVFVVNLRYIRVTDSITKIVDRQEMKQSLRKEASKKKEKEIKEILNPQQFQQYKSDKDAMKKSLLSRQPKNQISEVELEDQ